jgi:hypothetical protein
MLECEYTQLFVAVAAIWSIEFASFHNTITRD